MWMRSTMNYQYRYGTSTGEALRELYKQGGIRRFYQGLGPALMQAPISRFGDVAANQGVLSLMEEFDTTRDLPIAIKTGCASFAAASFRMSIMPIDACKTILQVEGANGLSILRQKIAKG